MSAMEQPILEQPVIVSPQPEWAGAIVDFLEENTRQEAQISGLSEADVARHSMPTVSPEVFARRIMFLRGQPRQRYARVALGQTPGTIDAYIEGVYDHFLPGWHHVAGLYVGKHARRRGLARIMLRGFEAMEPRRDPLDKTEMPLGRRFELTIISGNRPARGLYESEGYSMAPGSTLKEGYDNLRLRTMIKQIEASKGAA